MGIYWFLPQKPFKVTWQRKLKVTAISDTVIDRKNSKFSTFAGSMYVKYITNFENFDCEVTCIKNINFPLSQKMQETNKKEKICKPIKVNLNITNYDNFNF